MSRAIIFTGTEEIEVSRATITAVSAKTNLLTTMVYRAAIKEELARQESATTRAMLEENFEAATEGFNYLVEALIARFGEDSTLTAIAEIDLAIKLEAEESKNQES